MTTLDYYNSQAQSFYDRTIGLDLSPVQNKFLKLLPAKAHILDAGCGTGRDAKYFLDQGVEVTAFDASTEMVAYSSRLLGQPTLQLHFHDIEFLEIFEGIWANASLLHVPFEETAAIFKRLHQALKPKGIIFVTYKYGENHNKDGVRDFYNMTEATLLPYIEPLFEILELYQTTDISIKEQRPWLHFMGMKKNGT